MSKLTFRADEDLVRRVEALDASKSEIMREALRRYLDDADAPRPGEPSRREDTLDAMVADRVDELVRERLRAGAGSDVNVSITFEGEPSDVSVSDREADADVSREGPASDGSQCAQCGEPIAPEHVYCPNCGEKRSRRVFCDCGDELRSDWAFCPSCGRRTPAADVLD